MLSVDDTLYIVATVTNADKEGIETYLYSFDPENDEIEELYKLDQAHKGAAVASFGGSIYVFYGYGRGVYDTKNKRWNYSSWDDSVVKLNVKSSDVEEETIDLADGVDDIENYENATYFKTSDGICMIGAAAVENSDAEGNDRIVSDNFIWKADEETESAAFTANKKKISSTMVYKPLGVYCSGTTYFYGLTDSSKDKIVFASDKASPNNGNGWNSSHAESIYAVKAHTIENLPYTINVTNAVVYNGKKHGAFGIGKNRRSMEKDLIVSLSGIDADGFEIRSVRVKNAKNANCSPDGAVLESAKQPQLVIKLKAKEKLTSEKRQLLKTYNKILRKNPIKFNITQIDLTDSEEGRVSTFEMNNKGNKVKKLVFTTADNTQIKLRKKDYELSSDGKTITGKGNFAGSYTK